MCEPDLGDSSNVDLYVLGGAFEKGSIAERSSWSDQRLRHSVTETSNAQ